MPMNIITGGTGCGKSGHLYRLMLDNLEKNKNSRAVLIVPEQFSYTAEKTLSEKLGGLGLNRIEVATFSRLIKRIIPNRTSLLSSGKAMLLQKCAKSVSEENVYRLSASRIGFISSLSELFAEFKRYGIAPEDFDGIETENSHTTKKLASINELYRLYNENMPSDFADADDDLEVFAKIIEDSDIFENTFFYIDDYNDFLPSHYDAIKVLAKKSLGVFITLCIDEKSSGNLFLPVIKARDRLKSIADRNGIKYACSTLLGNCDYIKADDIRFLIENWEDKPHYPEKSENISAFNALDVFSEVEHTAAAIISLVRDSGYRFRDIGILCGNMEQYLHIMTSVFSDFGIPFFTDEKLSVTMHPIANTVTSLFDILKDNWIYSSVFDYLRAGYIYIKTEDGISAILQEDIDLLENYVLLHGIKGKKAWFSEWTITDETAFDSVLQNRSSEETDLEKLNSLRSFIIAPFQKFLENRGRTASAIAEAVFGFMCDINLYEGLLKECEIFDAEGRRDEAEQFKQVWNFVIETLDQLVAVSGNGTISREDFADRFLCGLSECQIATIPSGLDRVSLGTVSRNSPSRVKALFVIGALDGEFPKTVSEGNILSDFDRVCLSKTLKSKNKELAPDRKKMAMLENFKLYRAFTAATEKLFISFPSSDISGDALNPAHLVSELSGMFDISIKGNIISTPDISELLSSAKRGFYHMLLSYKLYRQAPPKDLRAIYDWYGKRPEFKLKLDVLKRLADNSHTPSLEREKAEMLYGKDKRYSITALERFEKCPFSYYLERGLRLTEQKEYSINKAHIGSILHLAVCEFCHIVEDGATSIPEIHERWKALTEDTCNNYINTVMEKISEKVLEGAGDDKNRIEYLLNRCKMTLTSSINTILKSLAKGEYVAVCYEKDFETVIDWKGDSIILHGTIDRIDIMEQLAQNTLNIRIVDYKSGNKTFSIEAICDKVDMQLVLYALAAEDLAKKGVLTGSGGLTPKVSAILYSSLTDTESTSVSTMELENMSGSQGVPKTMDGLFILEENEKTGKLIKDSLFDMDPSLAEGLKSDFLNISFNKGGVLPKNAKYTSRRAFEVLSKYIRKAAVDADKAIKAGNIDIKPYKKGNSSPCDYCGFKDICMFDGNPNGYRPESNPEDVYEFMAKEVD